MSSELSTSVGVKSRVVESLLVQQQELYASGLGAVSYTPHRRCHSSSPRGPIAIEIVGTFFTSTKETSLVAEVYRRSDRELIPRIHHWLIEVRNQASEG